MHCREMILWENWMNASYAPHRDVVRELTPIMIFIIQSINVNILSFS